MTITKSIESKDCNGDAKTNAWILYCIHLVEQFRIYNTNWFKFVWEKEPVSGKCGIGFWILILALGKKKNRNKRQEWSKGKKGKLIFCYIWLDLVLKWLFKSKYWFLHQTSSVSFFAQLLIVEFWKKKKNVYSFVVYTE